LCLQRYPSQPSRSEVPKVHSSLLVTLQQRQAPSALGSGAPSHAVRVIKRKSLWECMSHAAPFTSGYARSWNPLQYFSRAYFWHFFGVGPHKGQGLVGAAEARPATTLERSSVWLRQVASARAPVFVRTPQRGEGRGVRVESTKVNVGIIHAA
jgi:hypothetical protein